MYMKASDRFQDFLSQFIYLAQESNLAESEWKEELYYKLHSGIQCLVIRESNDPTLDFLAFVTACTQTANRLEMINSQEQHLKGRAPNTRPNTRMTMNQTNSFGATTASSPSNGKSGKLSDETRIQLMKEGRCFYCKEIGHLSLECPVKKRATELKALASSDEQQTEVDTEKSGKESP